MDGGEHLIDALIKLKFCGNAPMGGVMPHSYGDVLDFARGSQRIDEPWEIETLVDMSHAYCKGLQHGKNPFAKSPMQMFDDTQ